MSRDKFFDSNADFVSPKPQPQYSPYAQPPISYSSPSAYQYDRQFPAAPAGTTYSTPNQPAPSLSARPSLASRYARSDNSILLRSGSNASTIKKKSSSSCSFPCCGSRSGRTLCGCCVCFFFLVVAAVAAILLLAKAPEISFQSVEPPSNGLPPFAVDGPNFTMNFNLKIGIKNPNLVGVTVSKVMGEAKFPVSDSVIGYGNVTDLSIPERSNQVVLFPFQINYDPSIDPESKILLYVAKQCGLLGGTKGKLEVEYTIKLSFGFLATLGIVPSFDNKASFDCPLDGSSLPAGLASLATPPAGKRRRSLRSPIEVDISPIGWSEESSE